MNFFSFELRSERQFMFLLVLQTAMYIYKPSRGAWRAGGGTVVGRQAPGGHGGAGGRWWVDGGPWASSGVGGWWRVASRHQAYIYDCYAGPEVSDRREEAKPSLKKYFR